jgi:hypothetical protein
MITREQLIKILENNEEQESRWVHWPLTKLCSKFPVSLTKLCTKFPARD